MPDTMIDLGEAGRGHAVPADAGRPPVPWRLLLGVLAVVLVALASGSAPRFPPRPPTIIPARLGDATIVDGDRLFVVGSGSAPADQSSRNQTVTAYRLPDGRLLSRTTVAVTGRVFNVVEAGDTIVVSNQTDNSDTEATAAAAAGTDRLLWRRPDSLLAASGAAGIALTSADYGSRNEAVFSAVDLHTGAVRWTVRQPRDGYTTTAGPDGGYPQWIVTAHADGLLEVRDAVTGALTATRRGPPLHPDADPALQTAGRTAIVGGRGGATAYALPGLTPIWTTAVDLSQTWVQNGCGAVLCVFLPQQGMIALDAATGRLLWRSDRWASAYSAGNYLVAARSERTVGDPSSWVLDSRTGRVLGDFGGWEMVSSDAVPHPLYGVYNVPGQRTILYGVLDPARRSARILGTGEAVFGSCQSSLDALICRLVDASVAVWHLR